MKETMFNYEELSKTIVPERRRIEMLESQTEAQLQEAGISKGEISYSKSRLSVLDGFMTMGSWLETGQETDETKLLSNEFRPGVLWMDGPYVGFSPEFLNDQAIREARLIQNPSFAFSSEPALYVRYGAHMQSLVVIYELRYQTTTVIVSRAQQGERGLEAPDLISRTFIQPTENHFPRRTFHSVPIWIPDSLEENPKRLIALVSMYVRNVTSKRDGFLPDCEDLTDQDISAWETLYGLVSPNWPRRIEPGVTEILERDGILTKTEVPV